MTTTNYELNTPPDATTLNQSMWVPTDIYTQTTDLYHQIMNPNNDSDLEHIISSIGLDERFVRTIQVIGDKPMGQDLIWLAISRAIVHKINGDKALDENGIAKYYDDEISSNHTSYEYHVNLHLDDLYNHAVELYQQVTSSVNDSYCNLGIDWKTNREKEQISLYQKVLGELGAIKNNLVDQGIKAYPILSCAVGDSSEVQELITNRARRYLPRYQFRGNIPLLLPEAYVELQGLFAVYPDENNIFEVDYKLGTEDDICLKFDIQKGSIDITGTSGASNSYDSSVIDELMTADKLIFWHTHPLLSGPSKTDINDLFKQHRTFTDQEVYSVIYYPAIDHSLWLKIVET